jgi:hypothetical protein
VTAPGVNNWDFSLMKNTSLSEGTKLQFRAEVFNLPNHPQFAIPNRDASSTQFGKIFATSSPSRQIQLGLKVIF